MDKNFIVSLLATNDRAVCRALVVLNERQTAVEQASKITVNHNGRGFKPCHAFMGTSMANAFLKYGRLTPKQIAYWRKPDKRGTPRIACYWKQLLEVAEAKQKAALNES